MAFRSQRRAFWKAILLFTSVSVLLIAADWLSGLCGLDRRVDDLLGGFCAVSAFYLYERHARRQLAKQQHVIHLMNHHIRNALQPIMFLGYELDQTAQRNHVEQSVKRIDWALREVLPGNFSETDMSQAEGLEGKRYASGRSPYATSSPAADHYSSEARRNQVNPFFRRWLDTWRNQNGREGPRTI